MSKSLKTSYAVSHQVETFFTGAQASFDRDGDHVFCSYGSVINKVSVIDGQVKAQIRTKNEEDNVIRFTLSPDNRLIIIAYYSGLITKFDLTSETIVREFKSLHNAPISQLDINESSTLLASASSDGTIKLWDLTHHYCSHNFKGVNGVITCLKFDNHSGRELLLCAAGDDCIHIFDLESSKHIAKLASHCSTITDFEISQDGTRLLSVGRDKIAVLWNISSSESFGEKLRTIPLFESVESLALVDSLPLSELFKFSIRDDTLTFATIGEEGVIKYWDAATGSKIAYQNETPLSGDRNPAHHCFQLCRRPGTYQLSAISAENNIFLYNFPDLTLDQQLQGHLDEILSACWFNNNQCLALACNSNDLKIMQVESSKCQYLKGHEDIILCVKSVPSDPMCVISSSKDCTVLIWKFKDETLEHTIIYKATGHTHAVHSLAVSNSDKMFLSVGEDTTLKRWSFVEPKNKSRKTDDIVAENTQLLTASSTIKAHDDRINDVAISPNDQLVATGSKDKTARVFSANQLQLLGTLKGHRRGVLAIRFSPTDQVVVTAADMCLRMWNLQTFNCIKTFQGHDCAVLNFSILKSGLQIMSMGNDGNMKLWDCKTTECVKTIDAHEGQAWTLVMTEDDDKIVTGGQDEKLVVWRDVTQEEQEERISNLQEKVAQEQDFLNYMNKKRWRKALRMAIKMENQVKTLHVMREIIHEPSGLDELSKIISNLTLDRMNFLIDCCSTWISTAKNGAVGQVVLNIVIRSLDNEQLLMMPSLRKSIGQLQGLTEKCFARYERLVQQATFVDFFLDSFRLH